MLTRTKIICTIGPSCDDLETIMSLCREGMNIARLNFSHGTQADHLVVIERLKEARTKLGKPLAIMLDTKGPEMRLGKIPQGELNVQAGMELYVSSSGVQDGGPSLSITPGFIIKHIPKGATVLFDDGYISATAISDGGDNGINLKFNNSGTLKSGKGVNIPNINIPLPAVTEQDISDIKFGCRNDIDIIAASFIRSAEHLMTIKSILAEEDKPDILVVAKIENSEGVRNFDSIVQVADGIMIARGDLGVEVPLKEVPRLQKMMIRKSYIAGKPSVTATQMLESMIHNPRPTRAEVSDVANAIYDSTSAVMLSGETAIGKYPLESVKMMRSIIEETERDFNYHEFFQNFKQFTYNDVPSSVALATVKSSYSLHAAAIFALTKTGSTARLLSRLRPEIPIIAMTPNMKSYNQLSLEWGVVPHLQEAPKNAMDAFEKLSTFALDEKLVTYGDLIILTAGSPFGISGTTNTMIVESIGNVLVRAAYGIGSPMYGNVMLIHAPEAIPSYAVRGHIIVIAKCNETYLPLVCASQGVILQNLKDDTESENYLIELGKALNKTIIVRADGAFQTLKEQQLVTLNPDKGLVYKGVITSGL
jgi:pyruvate kinase